jgi:hypothetical protein
MIYNLFLNSTTDNPLTNYYSAASAANRGQRVYAVDWSFLPENKKYEVSFRFATRSGTFTANNLCYITANFGLTSTSVSGSSGINIRNNNILGIVKSRLASSAVNDAQLSALPGDNEPVLLLDRPKNNFVEIRILDNTLAQLNLTVDYILILSFKEYE